MVVLSCAIFFLLIAGSAPATVLAASSSDWHDAGQMARPRTGHSATMLQDGRVLVAGGEGGWEADMDPIVESTTELYDPGTNSWLPAGELRFPRAEHTATLLPGGAVLVVGGLGLHDGSFATEASTELFDPETGHWTSEPNMSVPRWGHTATLLPDGRLLVAGGRDFARGETSTAEIYDPATNSWRTAASMRSPRSLHVAVALNDGRVLVAGGYSGHDAEMHAIAEASAELYDPATDRWQDAGSMASPRADAVATLLSDGDAVVIGGDWEAGPATAERFDHLSVSWRTIQPPGGNGQYQTAIALGDGTLLLIGHLGPYPQVGEMLVWIFDPRAESWQRIDSPDDARKDHAATLLLDGSVLLSGGVGAGGEVLESAVRFLH